MNNELLSANARCCFRRPSARLCFCLVVMLLLSALASIRAAEPVLSLDNGLAFETPLLHPGKLDYLFKHLPNQNQNNVMAWSPTFRTGGGVLSPKTGDSTSYGGGYVRPLAPWPKYGDLILGGTAVDGPAQNAFEFQGEYRLPFGLGFGGGLLDTSLPDRDVAFGKVNFRNHWGEWNYILEVQAQEYGRETSPGGYGALYNSMFMGVLGTDGEQWRATLGFIAPWTNAYVRPALEVLYVDNSIGIIPGPKTWFANATLRYQGGFLGNASRLGRAMGPQGLEFANPLGFLSPSWNRRVEPWEMGGLVDLRAEAITAPNGTSTELYQGVVFPFQFADTKSAFDYLFIGGSYFSSPSLKTAGIIGGITGKVLFLNLSVGVEYQFERSATSVVVGLIDPF